MPQKNGLIIGFMPEENKTHFLAEECKKNVFPHSYAYL